MSRGYVYILFHSAMPGLVKIGQTTRDPSDRATEIGGTGVPGRFAVAYRESVPDCRAAERRIHQSLAAYRYDPRREFFQISLEAAIEEVRKIAEDERKCLPSPPASTVTGRLLPAPASAVTEGLRPASDRDFGQWRKGATVAQPRLKRATKIRSSGQLLIDAGSEA